jgi:hypothetical protein
MIKALPSAVALVTLGTAALADTSVPSHAVAAAAPLTPSDAQMDRVTGGIARGGIAQDGQF